MRFLISASLVLLATSCVGTSGSPDSGQPVPDAGPEGAFCTIDDECGGNYRCRGGVCIAEECTSRDDCLPGRICSGGECVMPTPDGACATGDECPTPYLCDGFARRCWDPATGEYLGGSASSSSSSGGTDGGAGSSSSSSSGGQPTMVSLRGFRIENAESSGEGVIPMDTPLVPAGGILLIAREATRSQFQQTWGVTLADNVVYLNSNNGTNGPPVINGNEEYSLFATGNMRVDGPTISGSAGKSIRRIRAANPGSQSSWEIGDDNSTGTPGVTELQSSDRGIFISEWSDRTGSGEYVFEFIEIYVNP